METSNRKGSFSLTMRQFLPFVGCTDLGSPLRQLFPGFERVEASAWLSQLKVRTVQIRNYDLGTENILFATNAVSKHLLIWDY